MESFDLKFKLRAILAPTTFPCNRRSALPKRYKQLLTAGGGQLPCCPQPSTFGGQLNNTRYFEFLELV